MSSDSFLSRNAVLLTVTAVAASAGIITLVIWQQSRSGGSRAPGAPPSSSHKKEKREDVVASSGEGGTRRDTLKAQDASPTAPAGHLTSIKGIEEVKKTLLNAAVALAELSHVGSVEVHDPSLGYVPPLLMALPRLRRLDLSGCSITYIPFSVTALTALEHLSVARNQPAGDLKHLPLEIGQLTNLKHLDASHNGIRALPNAISSLTKLELLNCMGNELESLPPGIGNLSSLRLLGLKSNRLTFLPPSFGNLSSLVELFITDNSLGELPKGFGGLKSLVKLQASFNSLVRLPEELGDLPRLELARFAVCQIKDLPGDMTSPPSSSSDLLAAATSTRWSNLAWFSLGGCPACAEEPPRPRAGLGVVKKSDLNLGEKLGDGASGEVFQATLDKDEVAVKFFRSDVSPDGRTAEEVAIAIAVDHPNLTRVRAIIPGGNASAAVAGGEEGEGGEGGGVPSALVLDLCQGKPLAAKPTSAHLLRCKWDPTATLSAEVAHRIARGVAGALAYLHDACICHGDVYAHNILVDQSGHATLCDFGASFYYRPAQRSFWEAMEVRAYGLFLRDLTKQTKVEAAESGAVPLAGPSGAKKEGQGGLLEGDERALPHHQPEAQDMLADLVTLSEWCLCVVPSGRPTFQEIEMTMLS